MNGCAANEHSILLGQSMVKAGVQPRPRHDGPQVDGPLVICEPKAVPELVGQDHGLPVGCHWCEQDGRADNASSAIGLELCLAKLDWAGRYVDHAQRARHCARDCGEGRRRAVAGPECHGAIELDAGLCDNMPWQDGRTQLVRAVGQQAVVELWEMARGER